MDSILSIAFIVAGSIALPFSIYFYLMFKKMKYWPKCKGTVIERIVKFTSDQSDGHTHSHPVFGLKYKYKVLDQDYIGVSSIMSSLNKKYKIDDQINVAYNPNNYQESDHFEKFHSRLYLFFFIPGIIFLAVGIKGVIW